MNLSVYVGPYLKVDKTGLDYEEVLSYEHLLMEGRGESGLEDDYWSLIPNVQVPGIDRQLSFSRHDGDMPLPMNFSQLEISQECKHFRDMCEQVIQDFHPAVEVCWGIVAGYS